MNDFAGIYCITNILTNESYIGSSKNIPARLFDHRKKLRSNRHGNLHMQNAWNLYGECYFHFDIVEIVSDTNDLIKIEQRWIDEYINAGLAYNIRLKANSNMGLHWGEETREKMSRGMKKLYENPDYRDMMYKYRTSVEGQEKLQNGHKVYRENSERVALASAKASVSMRGRKHSEEHNKKVSDALKGRSGTFTGKHHTEEWKKYMSDKLKGRPSPLKGTKLSDSHIKNMSIAMTGEKNPMYGKSAMDGKHHTEESKLKMSNKRKAYWEAKKGKV